MAGGARTGNTTAGGKVVGSRLLAVLCTTAALFITYGASRADAYVYYADEAVGGKNGTIGRAENDGSHPDPDFIKTPSSVRGRRG